MTREVYTDKKLIEFSQSHIFVRVFQDVDPQGDRLARKYRIPGVPTLVILNSSGEEIDQLVGFRPASRLIEEIREIIKASGRRIRL